jgi:Rrf2 family transcriptional regulator, iron-sulfur cluster assembly transcription factor
MRITKWGECGMLFAMHLARLPHAHTKGAAEIAASAGVDVQYAHQVLQRLRRGGIVESVRGAFGGYRLSRAPDQITLLQLLIAAEGESFEIICEHQPLFPGMTPNQPCHADESCSLSRFWRSLKVEIDAILERRTLASLVQEVAPPAAQLPLLAIGSRRAEGER